ncbi:CD2 antigen cytoplasmic tail-binding protein 2 homolog, partial [Eurytemora carolleeae]|uniref:CD2 antigen cytoplasmic tail-binding protein 2 homolog n=1 Tax=Eurytemora carolleeae TaxID=1294199 RepID=UPI000C77EFEF
MKDDDIEGQEDNTLNFDGDIQITPFNLKEEQQEGTFSKDGNFVWNEKKDDVKDAWLDDVDWVKVKQRTEDEVKRREEEDEKEEEEQGRYSEITSYKDMLALLQPGESVGRALRRLGGNKKSMSASERWKKKKAGEVEDPEIQKNKETMLKKKAGEV